MKSHQNTKNRSNFINVIVDKFAMTWPILESKGMRAIFQKKDKKRAKKCYIFKNLEKNVTFSNPVTYISNQISNGRQFVQLRSFLQNKIAVFIYLFFRHNFYFFKANSGVPPPNCFSVTPLFKTQSNRSPITQNMSCPSFWGGGTGHHVFIFHYNLPVDLTNT